MTPPPTNPRRQAAILSLVRWSAILILIFALFVAGYWVYTRVLNRPPADVYVAQRSTAVSAVYGTVTINANYALTLFSQNAGYLHENLGTTVTAQGIPVKKDQELGVVVDEIGERTHVQARNDYEAALSRQRLGPNTQGLLQSAQDTVNAYKRLPNPNAVPKVQRDAADNEVSRLTGIVANEKLELQRGVDATLSVLKATDDQLKRTKIVSPFDGILTAVTFNDNAFVLPNQALFTVATKETFVAGSVNEEDVGQLKPNMKAEVHLYAYSTTTFAATLLAVLPSPDPNSSRYTVTLVLDNPPDNLMYGETGEMNIILGRKENALVIPTAALQVDQVLIVEDGVVEQRPVKVGFKSLEIRRDSRWPQRRRAGHRRRSGHVPRGRTGAARADQPGQAGRKEKIRFRRARLPLHRSAVHDEPQALARL